ncbi:hypothetical protein HK100_001826 [Physocladia obscura]|uniref:SAM domain-containing protein n=1 Tax=Physocladia obscura TaxID=109957 RepID=A0AAD5XBI9_9FUNG|nr:hypothetical protein HK100_001826 [Physocladia obscura]
MSPIQGIAIVPRDTAATDEPFFIEAAHDCDAQVLEGTFKIKLTAALRNVRVTIDFVGLSYSRWEFGGFLATKPETDKDVKNTKVFHMQTEILYDLKEPMQPNPIGGAVMIPFRFTLPHTALPISYTHPAGSGGIEYTLRAVIQYQGAFGRVRQEQTARVIVSMPDQAKLRLLNLNSCGGIVGGVGGFVSSGTSGLASDYESGVGGGSIVSEVTATRVGYTIEMPRGSVVVPGNSLEVHVAVTGTPPNVRLRLLSASLRMVATFTNVQNVATVAKTPRPLSEITQSFPLLSIGGYLINGIGNGCVSVEPVRRSLFLLVDPELAVPSVEAPPVSIKTVFRLTITTDNSELPNVSIDVPITVIPPLRDRLLVSSSLAPSSPRAIYGPPPPPHRSNSISSQLSSPILLHQQSLPASRQQSVHSFSTLVDSSVGVGVSGRPPFRHPSLPGYPNSKDSSHLSSDFRAIDLDYPLQQKRHSSLYSSATEFGPPVFLDRPLESWTVEMVAAWVERLGGSEEDVRNFLNHRVDGGVLLGLSLDDLRDELEIFSVPLLNRLLGAIQHSVS